MNHQEHTHSAQPIIDERSVGAQETALPHAIAHGALYGLLLAPLAAAFTVGFDSPLIYFRYALHWAPVFRCSVVGPARCFLPATTARSRSHNDPAFSRI